jgi:HSP20 family molecular chaperone IbpA
MALRLFHVPSLLDEIDNDFGFGGLTRTHHDLLNTLNRDLQTYNNAVASKEQKLQMSVDMVERENGYEIKADLPGVDMKDVELLVDGDKGMVHISAKRDQVHEEKTGYSHRIERSFGQVKRSVRLPKNAQADSADARMDNGVLTIQFTKRPALENNGPKKLEIRNVAANNTSPAAPNSST